MTDSECPNKTEPAELNHTARDQMQQMISDKMAEINRAVMTEIKGGLDLLELARNSIYTEPMDVVAGYLREASGKFDINFIRDSREFNRLANVALEVKESEEEK